MTEQHPYLARAEDCERRAVTASSDSVRSNYLQAARGWRRLAAIPGLLPAETDTAKVEGTRR